MTELDAIKARIGAAVDSKREKVFSERRSRGTLADGASLFAVAWARGSKERNPRMPANRLIARDRALLKSQIVGPFRDSDVNIEEFAFWCAKNWDAIGATYFQKSKGYPETPAFRWLVVCLETYLLAFENKDYLDETLQLDSKNMRQKAATTDRVIAQAANAAKHSTDEITFLKQAMKELASENRRLKGEGKIDTAPTIDYSDWPKPKIMKPVAYDDAPLPRKLKRKLKP